MSDYAGLLEALKKRDEDANQSMIQKVHKAGGGKEEVQMNLKKINKGIKDSKDKRPTAKRKKVYNSPYGYKKGGVTIKKKSAKFSGGGNTKREAQFANESAAIAAREKHIKSKRNTPWSGSYWTTDHEGKRVVETINYYPRGSSENRKNKAMIQKAKHDKQVEEKRRQALIDARYED